MTPFDKLHAAGVPPQDALKAASDAINAATATKTAIERRHHRDKLFIAAWNSSLTTQQIADAMGITQSAVSTKASRWGLPPRQKTEGR